MRSTLRIELVKECFEVEPPSLKTVSNDEISAFSANFKSNPFCYDPSLQIFYRFLLNFYNLR